MLPFSTLPARPVALVTLMSQDNANRLLKLQDKDLFDILKYTADWGNPGSVSCTVGVFTPPNVGASGGSGFGFEGIWLLACD